MKSTEKGNILENAVHEIEKLIISNSALGNAKSITIDPKKKYYEKNSLGKKVLLHEVDLLVTIDFGFSNKLIYIIECRNWDCKSISKSQITDFEKKITYVGAAKGFFIAKKYSPAAKIIANDNQYLILLVFDSDKYTNIIKAPAIGNLIIDSKNVRILNLTLRAFNKSNYKSKPANEVLNELIKFNDEKMTFNNWLLPIINQEIKRAKEAKKKDITQIDSGTYTLKDSVKIPLRTNQLIYNGRSIKSVAFDYEFDIDIFKTKIIQKIDVEQKGRRIEYILEHPTKKGTADFTTIPSQENNSKWDIKLTYKIE